MHSSYPVIITLHWSKAHCHTATWRSLLCNRRMPAWPPAAPTKARQTFLWPSRPLLSAARSKISRSEWPWVLLRDRQREKIPNPIALMIETKHGAPADHRLQTWDWVCCHAYLPVASLKIWTHLFFFFYCFSEYTGVHFNGCWSETRSKMPNTFRSCFAFWWGKWVHNQKWPSFLEVKGGVLPLRTYTK